MKLSDEHSRNPYLSPEPERKKHTIVLFSADLDLCISLRMLFQDRYNVLTTTDVDLLLNIVQAISPDIVIADVFPTWKMGNRFDAMKQGNPHLRILLFHESSFGERPIHENIRRYVDAVFSKPVDLSELTRSITDFLLDETTVI